MQPIQIGRQIRQLRVNRGLPLRKVAAALDIDQSVLSKIERGERRATKQQILHIARIFEVDEKELLVSYLSDQVLYQIEDEELAMEALKVAEEKILYLKTGGNGR
jgi:HTH-type transcriptional regulator, competence development regulator